MQYPPASSRLHRPGRRDSLRACVEPGTQPGPEYCVRSVKLHRPLDCGISPQGCVRLNPPDWFRISWAAPASAGENILTSEKRSLNPSPRHRRLECIEARGTLHQAYWFYDIVQP